MTAIRWRETNHEPDSDKPTEEEARAPVSRRQKSSHWWSGGRAKSS
jgi:hypothetical protein